MDQEEVAHAVIARLEAEGHSAYLVGGCVRDKLMNRSVKDYDVTTSALPEQVIASFARTLPTGLQHGTVTVVIQGTPVEVTTFRTESKYEDHRRPASVTFVPELREDLQRRDFTINAIAMERSGRLIDPYGGRTDIERKVIRCVGDAHERFEEDALRMLRCLRFASNYMFSIEEGTWLALLDKAPLLRHIAMERVEAELTKMIAGTDPLRALRLLARSGLLRHTKIPLGAFAERIALAASEHPDPPSQQTASSVKEREELPERLHRWTELSGDVMRWAFLFAAVQLSPEEAAQGMMALVFPRRKSDRIVKLLEFEQVIDREINSIAGTSELSDEKLNMFFKKQALRYGKSNAQDWLAINALLVTFRGPYARLYVRLSDSGAQWLEEIALWDRTELAVTGAEIADALGREAGPWTAQMLDRLLAEAALQGTENDKSRLILLAQQYGKELEMP